MTVVPKHVLLRRILKATVKSHPCVFFFFSFFLWKHFSSWHFQVPFWRNFWLTRFLKLLVGQPPGVSDAQQVVFQSGQVRARTVTLWEVHAAVTPAVTVLANELALRFAANVVESCLNEAAPQIAWKDDLQPCGAPQTRHAREKINKLLNMWKRGWFILIEKAVCVAKVKTFEHVLLVAVVYCCLKMMNLTYIILCCTSKINKYVLIHHLKQSFSLFDSAFSDAYLLLERKN